MECLLACGFLLLLLATSIQAASADDPVVLKAGLSSREFKIFLILAIHYFLMKGATVL